MLHLTTSKAGQHFTEVLKLVRGGKRVVIRRHKKGIAALVPIEDLVLLREIEDRLDARAGRAALQEAEQEGTVPWEQVKAELGL